MTPDLEKRLLQRLYQAHFTENDEADYEEWADANGLPRSQVGRAAEELQAKGWGERTAAGTSLGITAVGICEAEQSGLVDPEIARNEDHIRYLILDALQGVREQEGIWGYAERADILSQTGITPEELERSEYYLEGLHLLERVAGGCIKISNIGQDQIRQWREEKEREDTEAMLKEKVQALRDEMATAATDGQDFGSRMAWAQRIRTLIVARYGEKSPQAQDVDRSIIRLKHRNVPQVWATIAGAFEALAHDVDEVEPSREGKLSRIQSNKVFIVHGHDEHAKEAVARVIMKLGLEPIILHEQASRSMTIIEKLEAHSEVGFAVVLLTPDDVGRGNSEPDLQPRARQNVLFELGYFVGMLGRPNTCALYKGITIPSDLHGLIYHPMDAGDGWKQQLAKELKAAGFSIDMNNL